MPGSRVDRLLVSLLIVLGGLFLYSIHDVFEEQVVDVGDKAPRFALTTESGRRVSRDEFGGKLLILNFWATWCPPCVEEMPSLNEFAREMAGAGVVVLGVSVDKDQQAYKRFLRQAALKFETAHDPQADVSAGYGTFKYPETYVIGRDGRVIQKHVGPRDWTNPQLVSGIKALL